MQGGVTCLVFNAVFDAVGTPEKKSDCGAYADPYAGGYLGQCLWLPNASDTPAHSPLLGTAAARFKRRTRHRPKLT
jgi:hypothetical protein